MEVRFSIVGVPPRSLQVYVYGVQGGWPYLKYTESYPLSYGANIEQAKQQIEAFIRARDAMLDR